MSRVFPLVVLLAVACSSTAELPARPADAGVGAPLDAGEAPDGGAVTDGGAIRDVGIADASMADTGPSVDAGPIDLGTAPVDCQAGLDPDWELCRATDTLCEVKFEDGSGCNAVCAALGLQCRAVYEDVDDQCAADNSRPALSCRPESGHVSDYCVCASAQCTPDCSNRNCGNDGCGGSCGSCTGTDQCNAGVCGALQADCSSLPYAPAALLAERMGYGARATGGDPGRLYRVTTTNDGGAGSLRAALESNEPYWIVFDASGTYTFRSRINVRSNKTIDGRGRDVTLEGALFFRDTRNIVVTDVKVTNTLEGRCGQDGDVLLFQGTGTNDPDAFTTRDIWINHVEAFDGGDGLIDLRGASQVTISWSHLHTHKKAMLMWRDVNQDPTPGMQVTLHHNFFDRLTLRGPQLVFGRAHMLNNYHYQWYEYGAASLGDAQMHSEGNIYEARPNNVCVPQCPDPNPCGDNDFTVSKQALVNDWGGNGIGRSRSVGDFALENAVIEQNGASSVFQPSADYSYTAEVATMALAQRIQAGAGPRTDYCQGP